MTKVTFRLIFTVFVLLLGIGACNRKSQQVERPREAWVLRSVLDQKPRMLSIALHDSLWIAYSTENAALYKAWTGGINFDGPVYTSAHGPQPTTLGTPFLEEQDGNPWRLVEGGKETVPEVVYKGHTIRDNAVTISYELVSNGQRIKVQEKPEFFAADGGKVGFERVFETSGVPSGAQVKLNMQLGSLQSEKDYETNGEFVVAEKSAETLENKQFHTLRGGLLLKSNDKTRLALQLTRKPMAALAGGEQVSGEEAVFALMAKSDCNTCHNKDVKTVGPAYMAIAERYENNGENTDKLVAKIIAGGAGSWGDIPMTPHPDLAKDDARTMVSYILALDAEKEQQATANQLMPTPAYAINFQEVKAGEVDASAEKPGIAINIYQFSDNLTDIPEIDAEMLPTFSGAVNALHADEGGFGDLKDYFVLQASGYITMKKATNIVFRLVSDDGSRLYIDDKLVVDNGGSHGLQPRDGEVILKPGKHAFRVDYFQGSGGKGLSLQWQPHGAEAFAVVPPEVFSYKGSAIKKTQAQPIAAKKDLVPGDAAPLEAVHPSFTLAQARPDGFHPKVGGMDFLSDGRMVISTWDSLGSVFILDGVKDKKPEDIKVKRIAFGLAEPLGLKVVDDEIYVLQKQELTKLVDLDDDDIIDEYQTVANGWKVSANFHEFAFGLLYKDGYFYGTLATAINPGGASTQPQIPDRGKVVKISRKDGTHELIASGLRTPNGIGFGVDNEIFIADNQGDWLPASKIVHLQENAWYGSRSVDFKGTEGKTQTPPVVWLPQDEIGNSPSQPVKIDVGPYKNQMLHGEVTHGGIKRVFAEKVNGTYQGVVFRFTQGLEAGVNRLVWGPDNALYVGGVGSTGNWQHYGKLGYGLQKLTYNDKVAFEMLAVRAKPNGIELEFTEPLKEGVGTKAADYTIQQWWYKPTADYGGPKMDEKALPIEKITLSPDRRKAFLQLGGMKPGHVVYVRLNKNSFRSSTGKNLWTTEAWYTMNSIPVATTTAKR
ncbi:PA14 domain-containing protein [Pontibacter sp. E15-1]|uniref:PA14 domain-containing protein n=1 Tax=Pontibacter sp. E15-1 TaxID=2919918 RepID=UPI001F4FB813|nr:PA14 domain-containing protein [Pontibacter sp. E15-1]MCJ8164588.1 PA14 domain-containing protein [Pontibacter sp. E15-1]